MKMKRILSMLLAVIILATAVVAAFPTWAFAANSAPSAAAVTKPNMYAKVEDDFLKIRQFASQIEYGSAAEMLKAEREAGQLMSTSSVDGMYTIYVNVYTGFMYYQNNVTGQVLTSNYYNFSNTSNPTAGLFSQVEIEYSQITNSSITDTFNSYEDAATYGQLYVSKISGGLRVNYTLGDTTLRFLVPGAMSQDRYVECLLLPMLSEYLEAAIKLFKAHDAGSGTDYYSGSDANKTFRNLLSYYSYPKTSEYHNDALFTLAALVMGKEITSSRDMDKTAFVTSGARDEFRRRFQNFSQLLNLGDSVYYCKKHEVGEKVTKPDANGNYVCSTCGSHVEEQNYAQLLFYDDSGKINSNAIGAYLKLISSIIGDNLDQINPMQEVYSAVLVFAMNYKAAKDGNYVECNIAPNDYSTLEKTQDIIQKYCVFIDEPTYSFNDMYKDEKECGYVHEFEQRAVFRCALEYTFNDDGTLSVSLPSNSISFDESSYILKSITPLKYFGASSLSLTNERGEQDGYVFYPDGSGAIVAFDDFPASRVTFSAPVYGIDHAYSDLISITGDYREQITMPVYGMVSIESIDADTAALVGTSTLNNGFFSVIEEGAALAKLNFRLEGTTSKLAIIYPSYQPYPSDTYDLSQTISVSGLSEYTMVSETKYSGSYVTRISMLSDAKLNSVYGVNYDASYTGMASCYRDYLKANGTIEAIAEIGNDLPLYIEAFGSMDVTKKILSFPVEVSMALTTFEDIRTMYDELSEAKANILAKAKYYESEAAKTEKDLELKALYEIKAEQFYALAEKVTDITNINFRLTGFANGGMKYTYPSKVKWDRVVGGKRGFEDLMAYAESVNAKDGATLGIYPEFDFLYITNTAAFDGIYPNGISSKLIDNRYAEKQLYNSVIHAYESFLTKLVSPDALEELYADFSKDYSDYSIKNISVSTLGSDVNSNFDDDEPVNRDEATKYISEILQTMKDGGYDVMINKGNSYSIKYATHILDAYIDSSHMRYASYTIPFFGMVLHGYVSYTGNAINYSGDPDYEILRSIENGASLYYILCYDNHSHMKEDEDLNKYYGVSYENWFANIAEQYALINGAIGDLQDYEIVDHKVLTVERVIDARERETAYNKLVNEFVANVESQIDTRVRAAFAEMNANGEYGRGVRVEIDVDSVATYATEILALDNVIQIPVEFAEEVKASIEARLALLEASFAEKYIASANPYVVSYDAVEKYDSVYNYLTDSLSTEVETYNKTAYTVENYNVVMVTYKNASTQDEVHFVLNYNVYNVIVNLEGEQFVLAKYDFKRIG